MNRPLALAATWLAGVVAVCGGGLLPDEYQRHVLRSAEPQAYPVHGVLQFVLVVTVQVAALWLIIRPQSYRGSWGRLLAAASLSVLVTLYFAAGLMHAPWYQYLHFAWSALVSLALVISFAASAAMSARRRRGP